MARHFFASASPIQTLTSHQPLTKQFRVILLPLHAWLMLAPTVELAHHEEAPMAPATAESAGVRRPMPIGFSTGEDAL